MEGMHQHKVAQMNQECGRQCWAFAQNHEANTMEERSTDLGERRRGCEVIRLLQSKEERMVNTRAMQ